MKTQLKGLLKYKIWNLIPLIIIMWVLEVRDILQPAESLDRYGISPRNIDGLWGILFAPFLHGNLPHLLSNTFPLLILGSLILLTSVEEFWIATFMSMVMGGVGVWALGEVGTNHLGASILVFGYMGFLLLKGFLVKNNIAIYMAVGVIYFFGRSIIIGVLPIAPGVSWEGHLFGFIGGLMAAHAVSRT